MRNFNRLFRPSYILRHYWIKEIGIAFLIFFIIIFSLELADRILFRQKSIFARSVRDFENQKSQIQILFLGQSDMQFAIIPDEFNYRAFNFAGAGENFIETYYKLKYYIHNMPELKIVVLPVNLASFSSSRKNEIQWEYFAYGYIAYRDMLELFRLKGPMVIREKLVSFCPIIRKWEMKDFLGNMRRLLTNQPIDKTEMYKGYVKNVGKNVTEEGALKRAGRHLKGQNLLDETFLLYFEKILKQCSDNKIKVFCVTLPVSNYYLEHLNKYVDKGLFFEKVMNNPTYRKYIYSYLDLLEIYAGNNDLFLNQDHLNYEGALKVSKFIASEWSKTIQEVMSVKSFIK